MSYQRNAIANGGVRLVSLPLGDRQIEISKDDQGNVTGVTNKGQTHKSRQIQGEAEAVRYAIAEQARAFAAQKIEEQSGELYAIANA